MGVGADLIMCYRAIYWCPARAAALSRVLNKKIGNVNTVLRTSVGSHTIPSVRSRGRGACPSFLHYTAGLCLIYTASLVSLFLVSAGVVVTASIALWYGVRLLGGRSVIAPRTSLTSNLEYGISALGLPCAWCNRSGLGLVGPVLSILRLARLTVEMLHMHLQSGKFQFMCACMSVR